MVYINEIKQLLRACDAHSTIYRRKPVRAPGKIRPLTFKQREEVEKVSTERGYRRFTADYAGN